MNAARVSNVKQARLGLISAEHLYNLRANASYRQQHVLLNILHGSKVVAVSVRKAPEGWARFIGIDSVHQGDRDAIKDI
jgi:hypothetical protein